MMFRDLLRLGSINLWRRRTRSLLTALSLTIGVVCVVVLFSVGLGYERAYRASLEELGSLTKIDVLPPTDLGGKTALLNDKAVAAIQDLPGVEAVTPVLTAGAYLSSGSYVNAVKLYGIDIDTAGAFQLIADQGVAPGAGYRLRPELLVTADLAESFTDPKHDWAAALDAQGRPLVDLLSSPIKLTFDPGFIRGEQQADTDGRALMVSKAYNLHITGVSGEAANFSSAAFLDIRRLQEWVAANKGYLPQKSEEALAQEKRTGVNYDLVWVKAGAVGDVQAIAATIREAGLSTYTLNDMLETVRRQSRQIQGMLGAIGAVALLVAGLGVTSTMMMSINERVREVGVLKVLGTELSDIAKMFLTEALILGLIGGLAGLALSYLVKALLPLLFPGLEIAGVIPPWLALLGVAFSGLVALAAALLPALKAMRISPNMALRAE